MEAQKDCKVIFPAGPCIDPKKKGIILQFLESGDPGWDTDFLWDSCWISCASHRFVTLKDNHEVSLVDELKKDKCHFLCLMQVE